MSDTKGRSSSNGGWAGTFIQLQQMGYIFDHVYVLGIKTPMKK